MATPNYNKRLTPKLTPEQAAELNRRQAAKRQADKRARERQEAEDAAAMLAENAAKMEAEEAARVAHLADVERRLVEAEKAVRETQERLDNAILLLACHHDLRHLTRVGVSDSVIERIGMAHGLVGRHYQALAHRSWAKPRSEALGRIHWLLDAVEARRKSLPSYDDPVLTVPDVTVSCTPVTRTVRNAHEPESNADRSHEAPPVSDEEQAWIDSQDRDPYDPYQDYVERMEAIAEGNATEDDNGERF